MNKIYRKKPINTMTALSSRFFQYDVRDHLKLVGKTKEVHGLRLGQRLKLINEDYFKDYVEEYFFRHVYHFGTSEKLYDFVSKKWGDRDSEEGSNLEQFHYDSTFESFYCMYLSGYYKQPPPVKRITLEDRLVKNGVIA